jgi:hypothetical protein
VTTSDVWSAEAAARYDETYAELAAPEALGPTLDLLVELADGGRGGAVVAGVLAPWPPDRRGPEV